MNLLLGLLQTENEGTLGRVESSCGVASRRLGSRRALCWRYITTTYSASNSSLEGGVNVVITCHPIAIRFRLYG